MAYIKERYYARVVPTDSTVILTGASIGGFLPKTNGAITVVNGSGETIIDAVPVTAGVYVDLPFFLGGSTLGGTFTTSMGASGTLGV